MRFPIKHRMKVEGYPDWPFRRAEELAMPSARALAVPAEPSCTVSTLRASVAIAREVA